MICEQIAARTPSDNPPERSQPDNLTNAFKRFVNKNELGPLRFQDLRHTHATLLLRDGVYVKVVSERLGHASVAITLDTYADFCRECRPKLPQGWTVSWPTLWASSGNNPLANR